MMDDLISRQALMKEFADFVKRSNNSDFARIPTWNDAVSLVDSMPPAQPAQQWIPVSERLPYDFQQVLVWYEYWHWNAEELKPEYGIGWRFRGLWCGDPGNGSRLRVIAWMPLPEPPKEEQE